MYWRLGNQIKQAQHKHFVHVYAYVLWWECESARWFHVVISDSIPSHRWPFIFLLNICKSSRVQANPSKPTCVRTSICESRWTLASLHGSKCVWLILIEFIHGSMIPPIALSISYPAFVCFINILEVGGYINQTRNTRFVRVHAHNPRGNARVYVWFHFGSPDPILSHQRALTLILGVRQSNQANTSPSDSKWGQTITSQSNRIHTKPSNAKWIQLLPTEFK